MTRKRLIFCTAILAGVTLELSSAQTVQYPINIAGGFTPAPLMLKAGEQFIKKSPQHKIPQFLNNDTTGGFKLFCAGAGADTPSINTGTRDIRPAELELCAKNGVNGIVQLNLGRDALVSAQGTGGRFKNISRKDIFLAIAKDVPDPKDNTKLIPNPYKTWKNINPDLPDTKIQVLAPQSTIGLYQTYLNSVVLAGCKQIDSLKALETSDSKAFDTACKSFRKDGAYVEYERTGDAIQQMKENPDMMGFVSLTMVLKNNLNALVIDNMEPSPLSVSRNTYELTFSLQVFVKPAHVGVIPGLKEYLTEVTSEEAVGLTGYYYDMGVIPLPLEERKKVRAEVQALAVASK